MTYVPLAPPASTPPAPPTLDDTLRYLCTTVAPLPGHATLLDALRRAGGPDFSSRLSRGGWFRPGRILDAQAKPISEDALGWLERAWSECGEDGALFAETYADSGLTLTLEQGVSHYFVSPAGAAPDEYFQLEIEELQEVLSHPVGRGGEPVEALETLLDRPADSPAVRPIGASRYRFRRLTDIRAFLERIEHQAGKPAPVLRFMKEWSASSAGQQRHFCDHWVLALSEHLDRYRQARAGAIPVAAHAPLWDQPAGLRGTALARQLHDFDRGAGYAFAWYFHMVSAYRVPRSIAPEVFNDLQEGMAYLPERDAALIHEWMREPYAV